MIAALIAALIVAALIIAAMLRWLVLATEACDGLAGLVRPEEPRR